MRPPQIRPLRLVLRDRSRDLGRGVRSAVEPAIVRGFVVDEAGRIFLVKHTYVRGWHLPGGGVEPGETLLDALARELKEEGNIDLLEPPALHAVYFNKRVSQRDHVALFVVTAFRQPAPPKPDHEILAH